MRRLLLMGLLALGACRSHPQPVLPIGADAPDFALPGVDGKTHSLRDYAASQVLVVVFTCNHCPASQMYEGRVQQLHEDYRSRGVAVVAINPESPASLPDGQLAYSDVGETLDGMRARAAYRHLDYPYLADSGSHPVSGLFGVVAMPHVFVFDRERKLRYEGRIDDNVQEPAAKTHDTRDAIDALLASKSVGVAHTTAVGCPPTIGMDARAPRPPDDGGVAVEMATAPVLKTLRANGTKNLLLVNFWATWCGPCAVEFPDLVATSRMYRSRGVDFVSVSENQPEEKALVLEFLKRHRASNRNLLFATPQTYEMQAAFDPAMPAAVPFTLVIAPNGDVVYQELGSLDILKMRRAILANLPDDRDHPGLQAYWAGGHP